MADKVVVRVPFPAMFLLFLLFLGLKLTGYIAWSWWWVTAPLWAPIGIAAFIFVLMITGMFIMDYKKGRI